MDFSDLEAARYRARASLQKNSEERETGFEPATNGLEGRDS